MSDTPTLASYSRTNADLAKSNEYLDTAMKRYLALPGSSTGDSTYNSLDVASRAISKAIDSVARRAVMHDVHTRIKSLSLENLVLMWEGALITHEKEEKEIREMIDFQYVEDDMDSWTLPENMHTLTLIRSDRVIKDVPSEVMRRFSEMCTSEGKTTIHRSTCGGVCTLELTYKGKPRDLYFGLCRVEWGSPGRHFVTADGLAELKECVNASQYPAEICDFVCKRATALCED